MNRESKQLVKHRNNIKLQHNNVDPTSGCSGCDLTKGLKREQVHELSAIVATHGIFERDERIYRSGDQFKSIFVVKKGSIKTEAVTYDGRAVVTGFYLPGDLFGIEGIGGSIHSCDALALESTMICELPFTRLERLCHEMAPLQHNLITLLGRKIGRDDHAIMMMHNMRAECRVSRFLTLLHQRLQAYLGKDIKEISLPMSKDDIAKYLGCTPETLSRILTRLSKEGIIRNKTKTIELLDIQSLYKKAS